MESIEQDHTHTNHNITFIYNRHRDTFKTTKRNPNLILIINGKMKKKRRKKITINTKKKLLSKKKLFVFISKKEVDGILYQFRVNGKFIAVSTLMEMALLPRLVFLLLGKNKDRRIFKLMSKVFFYSASLSLFSVVMRS